MMKRPITPADESSSQAAAHRDKKDYTRIRTGRSRSHSLVIFRGMPDYVDITTIPQAAEPLKTKKTSRVFHPVFVCGLVTTVIYGVFISLLLAYMNFKEFREFVFSLKRLANIMEWFRIIFKPWQSNEKNHTHERDQSHSPPEAHKVHLTHLDPEADVRVAG